MCFLSQIIKFYPGNGTAPRVNCTYVVRVWGLGLTQFKHSSFESKCNGDQKKYPCSSENQIPNIWNILSSVQVLAPADMLRKKTLQVCFISDHLKIDIFGLHGTFAICFHPPVVTLTPQRSSLGLSECPTHWIPSCYQRTLACFSWQ